LLERLPGGHAPERRFLDRLGRRRLECDIVCSVAKGPSMVFAFLRLAVGRSSCRIPALVVLVVCCLTTVELRASCGDYLHVGNAASAGRLVPGLGSLDYREKTLPVPAAPRTPVGCRGPNCQAQIPVSFPPAPVAPSSHIDLVALCVLDSEISPHDREARLDLISQLPVEGHPVLVKRPPRS
jgi:hypothetical protein